MASVIPRKKVLIPRFTEEPILGFGKEENGIQKISFTKNPPLGQNFESLLLFFSTEGNFEHFPPLGYGSERNSQEFSVPRNGSERNSVSFLLFLFHGTEFQAFFSSV